MSELKKKQTNTKKTNPTPNYTSNIKSLTARIHQPNHLHHHFHCFSHQTQNPETNR